MKKPDEYSFVVGINNLKSAADLGGGLNIGGGIRILSPEKIKRSFLDSITESVGSIEVGYIKKCSLVAFSSFNAAFDNEQAERLTFMLCASVNAYLDTLWLYHDCCAYTELGVLKNLSTGNTHTNRDAYLKCMSDGTRRSCTSTKAQLLSIKNAGVLKRFYKDDRVGEVIARQLDTWWRTEASLSHSNSTRLERAWGFLVTARQSDDLGLKIAHYCSSLEAMLSSGTGELRHKVAERVAILSPRESRRRDYENVKKLYDIRSRVLHGETINKKSDLASSSRIADSICRALFTLAISEDSPLHRAIMDNAIDDFFIDRLLRHG